MINGKAIYTTKGAAYEYGRVGCNFYTGCPHNCEYCYLKRGITGKALGKTEVTLKKCFKDEEDAFQVFVQEIKKHKDECWQHGVFFSFTTDPMIAETRWLTIRSIVACRREGIVPTVLTKDATFLEDDESILPMLVALPKPTRRYVHFGFTLTGRDDMEPNASTNAERIKAMERLHTLGFSTFASIEPVVDWESSQRVIEQSLPFCNHYKIGLRSGVKKDYYDTVEGYQSLVWMKQLIVNARRTVYFKESVRKWMQKNVGNEPLGLLLDGTVDADGNEIDIPLPARFRE